MSWVELGSDGLDYIATVDTTSEGAKRVTASLRAVTDRDWARFVSRAGEGT